MSLEMPHSLLRNIPSSAYTERQRIRNLSSALGRTLDRVNVLGDESCYGHTGCVNALSWTQEGDALLSGGDDTTVRIWKMDTSTTTQELSFISRCVVDTGHGANIFSAKMLPRSSRIATAAGDMEVRVFDVGSTLASTSSTAIDREINLSTNQSIVKVIRCHHDRVKRIVTEDSPDLFLSVAEDGTVRQHDLRTTHTCDRNSCPAPLAKIGHKLTTLSLSPLTPYQFVVGGDGPYGYLYDRRYSRRRLETNWGAVPRADGEITTCVRKFGRRSDSSSGRSFDREHITGARVSKSNGHEVILSYSGDGVYLFSTMDEPSGRENMSRASPGLLASCSEMKTDMSACVALSISEAKVPSDEFRELSSTSDEHEPHVPRVMPRRHYTGTRNTATIKDVNFLGPEDEWVTSGSDDGNFFIWDKLTGSLHGIYEGDSTIVNMVEGHPHLPLIAVSGIDTTVKLFSPTSSPSTFSRSADAEQIMETNSRLSTTRGLRFNNLAALLAADDTRSGVTIQVPECLGQ